VRHGGPVVVLVPRQLRMTGMTGDVPYYGGRFTPAQAYAASHRRPAPPPVPPAPSPAALAPPAPSRAPTPGREPHDAAGTLDALAHLRDTGVLSSAEYDELRARVP
jgi:hypothetical protein